MFKDTKAFSGFAVDDLDAARAFYGDTLGIETDERDGAAHAPAGAAARGRR